MGKLMEMFQAEQQKELDSKKKEEIKTSIRRKRGQNLTKEEQALYPEVLKEDMDEDRRDREALYPEHRHKPGH